MNKLNSFNHSVSEQVEALQKRIEETQRELQVIRATEQKEQEVIDVLLQVQKDMVGAVPIEPRRAASKPTTPPVPPVIHTCPYCEKRLQEPVRNPKLWEVNLQRHIRSVHPEKLNVNNESTIPTVEAHTTTEGGSHVESNEAHISDAPQGTTPQDVPKQTPTATDPPIAAKEEKPAIPFEEPG